MISKKDVEHIAKLARLEIGEKEKTKFEKELSEILDFIEKLNEVDTTGILPVTGGVELANILRPDEEVTQELEDKAEELLGGAPETKENWIKVRAIFS
ncbi:MAG: Asp-tRNA(Asn)/Glu-tRNA(Gln) amidotransferase subunit GatC [bacterium]|nr:Asp-tRNA(Asn)/Glu-tRNA(Gln) amidotransferase subunit GatC [bacterium]